jgi:hypothetical protein
MRRSDAGGVDSGHDSAIAALLVADRDSAYPRWSGLLPGADLYAAAVVQRHGDRSVASAVSLAAAIDWMVAAKRAAERETISSGDDLSHAGAVMDRGAGWPYRMSPAQRSRQVASGGYMEAARLHPQIHLKITA